MEDRPCVLRMRLELPELARRDQLGTQRDQEHDLEGRRFYRRSTRDALLLAYLVPRGAIKYIL
jgi:hypothetical protein